MRERRLTAARGGTPRSSARPVHTA